MDAEANLQAEIIQLQQALAISAADNKSDNMVARLAAQRLNLLESIMETIPVGIVIAEKNGHIVHGNSHVVEMVRHPVLHSSDVDDYEGWVSYHADGRRVESHEYPLSRVLREGEEKSTLDVHYQRGDGTRFWMRIIGTPVHDADGEVIGASVALIDIDEETRLRESQAVLIGELNHRVKNAFAVVKSIVSQSLRKVTIPTGLRETIDRRLDAYATAHAKLIGTTWSHAPLATVAHDVLDQIGDHRISIQGDPIEVPSRQALAFSMAFYELATNALKYGALSVPDGSVELSWQRMADAERCMAEISWKERGGPVPQEPDEKGFGSFITGRALQMETGGKVQADYPADGYEWRLRMPLKKQSG